jgi:hypothetical protein
VYLEARMKQDGRGTWWPGNRPAWGLNGRGLASLANFRGVLVQTSGGWVSLMTWRRPVRLAILSSTAAGSTTRSSFCVCAGTKVVWSDPAFLRDGCSCWRQVPFGV